MYTAKNFRYTFGGWVVDVRHDGATLNTSIPAYDINAADCRNFDALYRTQKTLPYNPRFGQVVDVVNETAEVNAELAVLTPTTTEADADDLRTIIETLDTADWLGEVTASAYGQADLGTRHIISGGEVMELDGYDEANGGDDLPF